ncbi:MAG: ABC transporter permease [Clostridia bacterium]|nr:ABC transporter permease [Clostridia bacterium]
MLHHSALNTIQFSEDLIKLWEKGILLQSIWETVYITLLSTAIAYLIGLPLGILIHYTSKDGIHPIPWLNKTLSVFVNVLRSIPFIILMVALVPFAKTIIGKSYGNGVLIVTLIIAAFPYVARMVESSVKEVDRGIIEAAQSMGASDIKIILKVLLPEAKPSLITGAVISTVTVLGYSAMAATIGAGGLGMLAITYGHQRFNDDIIWICVFLTILLVVTIQELGMLVARKTDKRIKK